MMTVLGFCLLFSHCSIQQSLVHNSTTVQWLIVTVIHLKCMVELIQVQPPFAQNIISLIIITHLLAVQYCRQVHVKLSGVR